MARWLVLYRVTTYTGQLCKKYKATENFGNLSGDHNIHAFDRYIQVNFAENIIKVTGNFGKLSGDHNIQGDHYIQGHYVQVWLYYLEFVIHGGRGSSTCGSLINKTTELKVKL